MVNQESLKFGEFRKYVSVIDRISICIRETQQYKNYRFIRDVPASCDSLFVYGVGMIESEFPVTEDTPESQIDGKRTDNNHFFAHCIEIVLAERPRDEFSAEG